MADNAKQMKAAARTKEAYAYPSRFGSHKSMVNELATAKLEDPDHVVCVDEYGEYVTETVRLDNGCADSNRFATHRLTKLLQEQQVEH